MAQTGQWVNGDGLRVKFGAYYRDPSNFVNRTRFSRSIGPWQTLEFDVDVTRLAAGATSFTSDNNNDGVLDGFQEGDVFIPPSAAIQRVTLVVNVPFVGGTSITMGLYQMNGTALSATGLITATAGAVANLGTAGNKITGDGAYTTATNPTADWGNHAAFPAIAVAGTFTAGTGRIIVEYLETNLAPLLTP